MELKEETWKIHFIENPPFSIVNICRTALTYTIIYTMVPRRLIFRQDPNYNKIAKTADSKANYENTIYERMGYIDYYDTKELQEKASSLISQGNH